MAIQKVQPELVDSSKDFTFANVTATSGISTGNLAVTSNVSTGNLTSNGTVNFTNASNVSLGSNSNLHISGGSSGQYLQTDGSGGLTWASIATASTSNGTSNLSIPVADGNINLSVGGNSNVLVVTSTGINISGTLNATGNANFYNLTTNKIVSTDLAVSGNLNVSGNLVYANVTTFNVKDPIIEQGQDPSSILSSNDGLDRGQLLHYYVDGNNPSPVDAFMGWDNSNGEFAFGSNVSVSNNVVTFNTFGNVRANYFIGNGALLSHITGSNVSGDVSGANHANTADTANAVTGSNVTGQVSNALVAGTVYTNAQPNITSIGTLTSLSVTGNLSSGNASLGNLVTGNFFSGNGALLSYLNGANVSGDVSGANHANVADTANSVAGANVTGQVAYAAVANSVAGANVTGEVSFAAVANSVAGANVTGQVSYAAVANSVAGANVTGQVAYAAVANSVAGANVSGDVSGANHANVADTANSVAGSNVSGQVGNSLVAGTVYTNAQPNITSVGTLSSLDVTGNVTAGNVKTDHLLYANGTAYVFTTNAAGSNTQIQFNDANAFAGSSNFTFDKTTNTLSITNITATVANTGNLNVANYVTGNLIPNANVTYNLGSATNRWKDLFLSGNTIDIGTSNISVDANGAIVVPNLVSNTNITAGNLSVSNVTSNAAMSALYFESTTATAAPFIVSSTVQVANLNVATAGTAATVTASAQPNITSVGTLVSATITGNISAGNVKSDHLLYANGDPYVFTTNAAGSNTQVQFNNSNAFAGSSNFTFDVSTNTLSVTNIIANGSQLTHLTGANVSGDVSGANHANIADVANSVAGANVTGQVSYAAVANSVAGANVTGQVSYAAVANSVAGANVSGDVSGANHANVADTANAVAGANVTGQVSNALVSGTVYTNAQPNITSLGTLTSVTITGNATAGNVKTDHLLYANGDPYAFTTNAAGSNTYVQFNDANTFSGSANFTFDKTTNTLSVTNIVANGSGLTSIPAANISGQVANALVASTVYTNAQPNITSVGTLNGVAATGTVNFGSASNVTLGNVANVHISGGNAGAVLKTDGSGNLSWIQSSQATLSIDTFTGNGVQTTFVMNNAPYSTTYTTVVIDGIVQLKSTYSLSNANIIFSEAPPNSAHIEITSIGDLSLATVAGGNVTGQVSNALVAGTVYTNAQPNITSLGTLSSLTITGNVTAGNANLGNAVTANYIIGNGSLLTGLPAGYANSNVDSYLPTYTGNISANYFIGNGSTLTHITGANVDGQVGNSLVSSTVYSSAQPNITSLGTLTSVTVTGNVTAGNIRSDHLLYANGTAYVFTTNAAGSNTQVQFNDANAFAGSANFTFNKSTNTLAVTNLTSTNATITTLGVTGNATVSNLVANNQITAANATITGNLTVNGTTTTVNVLSLSVENPIIKVGRNTNNTALTVNDGKDRGEQMWYFSSSEKSAFVGYDLSAGNLIAAVDITNSSDVITVNDYGNFVVGTLIAQNNISAGGNLSVTGNSSVLGNSSISGNITVNGSYGNINAGNVTVQHDTVISGNATISGNLIITGTTTTTGANSLVVQDPIISMGRNAGNTALTTNDGKDRGGRMWYYAGTEKSAFMGYDNSTGNLIAATDVTIASDVVTVVDYGNFVVGSLYANTGSFTGNVDAGNIHANAGTITAGNLFTPGSITGDAITGNTVVATAITANTTISANSINANYINATADFHAVDVTITGNLTVSGTTTTLSVSSLTVADNMVYLNNAIQTTISSVSGNGTAVVYNTTTTHNYVVGMVVTVTGVNPSGYNVTNQAITAVTSTSFTIASSTTGSYVSGGTARAKSSANPDLGIAGGYNDGTYHHAGFFRDATDGVWKVFDGYTIEPDSSVYINTADPSFSFASFKANVLYSDVATGTAPFVVNSTTQVANLNVATAGSATTAGTVTTAAQPNITSVSTSFSGLTLTSNGNISLTGSLSQLSGANLVSASYLTGTLTTGAQPNITSTGTLTSLGVTGAVTANTFTSNIATGTAPFTVTSTTQVANLNVATAGSATTAGTVTTAAQPNITSVGTLSSVSVTGNVTAGNVKTDNLLYANGSAYTFVTPGGSNTYIQFNDGGSLGGNANLTFDKTTNNLTVGGNIITGGGSGGNISGVNYATANYFTGTLTTGAQPNITSLGTLTSLGVNGTVTANTFTSNIATGTAPFTVTSTTQVANLNVATAGSATTAGTVTTAAQPNITSVGTLASLGVTGAVTASTLTSNVATGTAPFTVTSTTQVANLNVATAGSATTAGTVTGNAQANITSVGTLTSLSVSGNANVGNLGSASTSGAEFYIVGATQSATNGAGGNIIISAGIGNGTGAGGQLYVYGGNAKTTGNAAGGLVAVTGGVGYGQGQGGQVGIFAGASGNASGGFGANVVATGGTYDGLGGNLLLQAGSSYGTNKAGSTLFIMAGPGTGSAQPGNIAIQAATATTSGAVSQTLANVVVVAGTGVTITGTLSTGTGNANVGNIGATAGVFTTVAGSLTTASQPNITSHGTLNALSVASGSLTASNAISITQTWNNSSVTFSGITENITDTASAAGSLLLDLQVGGTSKFNVSKAGAVSAAGGVTSNTFTSNVATGTAPFTVTSTTQVANLNVATAGSATTSGTVTTAAQPNITSVSSSFSGLTLAANGNIVLSGANSQVTGANLVSATILTSTVATGTAPFTVTSTTQVANLNVATAGAVVNSLTFNTTGGAASGTTYNGSVARTIDYSTVGAAASTHTHAASDITSGTMATARLASGTANATTYLRGDQTWATISSGTTTSAVTFTTTGGAASGTTFNGSSAVTIDYSTVGAASSAHTHSYLSSESDTLATVTGRGATTSTALTFSGGFNDGYITYNLAQINRAGAQVELQYAGGSGSTVGIGANGSKPIIFYANTGNATFGGTISATSKSFLIDHPTKEGYKLRYGSLEGPENGVYVRGKLKGTNVIELPDYWTGLVHEDSITVQLTPIGKHQKLYVEDIRDNKVYVANDGLFAGEINCFYYVQAERKDVDKLEVEFESGK